MMLLRPCLKSYTRMTSAAGITFHQEVGVQFTLPDPDGQVLALLELLDGTRAIDEITLALAATWPQLTAGDVAEGIACLDGAGLLEDAAAQTDLSPWQQERYFSNLAFFGTFAGLEHSRYQFQETLCRAHVLLLGVGGLGSTLLYNLAGLGVGHVTILDYDTVEIKNLARQFLYSEAEVGLPKLGRAAQRARSFNSEMRITAVEQRVRGPEDVAPLLPGVDLTLAAIDQPAEVHDWVNQACVAMGVPFITGGMQVTRGLYYSVAPGHSGCLTCRQLFMDRQYADLPSPVAYAERVNRGIGPVASLMGSLIALEAVRYLSGFAPPISAGKIWLVDFVTGQMEVGFEWPRLPDCPMCGTAVPAALKCVSAATMESL
jgi:molybdopterin-synthase adenylyltransferase